LLIWKRPPAFFTENFHRKTVRFMTSAADDYSQWIGRTDTVVDDVSPATAKAAAATLSEESQQFSAGTALPPLWHWFYFLAKAPQARLGLDGHPQREGNSLMPPLPYPRRMFAGARLTWHRPLIIGRPGRREAVIRNLVKKSGKSGELAFVTVGYEVLQENVLCVEEEQDIVYREAGPALAAPESVPLPPVPQGAWSRQVVPDTRLLFRFSALTFNAHRIHYDRPYAVGEEGYPGLVVHGPLTAILLLQLVRENTSRRVTAFSFRSRAPLFDLAPFRLIGVPANGRVELEAHGPDGKTAMTAIAELG
jgi:3-methylfumaryl-CoA hydratase